MEYILGKKAPGPCIFCAFPSSQNRRDDLVLCVQKHAFVCLNRYPFAAGHLLVVPRSHVARLADLDDEVADALFRLLRTTTSRLDAALSPEGINLGFNLGLAAGAGIAEHLHAHVVPRWVGDANFMPVLADMRIMPEYLATTYDKLLPSFVDLDEP
jgi:ATP adenylyltransferase